MMGSIHVVGVLLTLMVVVCHVASESKAQNDQTFESVSYSLVASYTLPETITLLSLAAVYLGDAGLAFKSVFGVKAYTVSYTAKLAGDGTPGNASIQMSGLLLVPMRQTPTELTTVAFMHETVEPWNFPSDAFSGCNSSTILCIPSASNAPVAVWGGIASASMGYAVIVPDGVGTGLAFNMQDIPYLISEGYAIATFNLFAAATSIIPNVVASCTVSQGLVVAGYSEGGYAAMAVHKESYNESWAESEMYVAASYPSGGPYDLYGVQLEQYIADPASIEEPYFLAFLAFSYRTYLGIPTVLNENLALQTVLSWFSGEKDVATVDSEISSFTQGSEYGVLGIFNTTEIQAFETNESTAFTDAVKRNDLVDGGGVLPLWTPQGNSRVRMCHGEADTVVFIANAEMAVTTMDSEAVTLKKIPSDKCSSHGTCAVSCLSDTLGQLWSTQNKEAEFQIRLTIIAAVVVTFVVLGIGIAGYGIYKCRQRDDYSMIA
eukprot:m.262684 g.262684  ORF g.262684 m.262684 type:complete len:490 (-) comp46722_c0_seq1:122-1591(-)